MTMIDEGRNEGIITPAISAHRILLKKAYAGSWVIKSINKHKLRLIRIVV